MLFFDIDFFALLHRFWRVLGLQVGAKFVVLGFQDAPKSLQKSNLLGTCVPDASQEAPEWLQRGSKEGPEVDF